MKSFKALIAGLLILIVTTATAAPLSDNERQDIFTKNILAEKNPGFENGKAGWTASGGTFAIVVSGSSNLLTGRQSATWDSGSASQTLSSTAVTIPKGLYGTNGVAACKIQTPTGTATHTISVYDGTNTLASQTIASTTAPNYQFINFVFPTSGSVRIRLTSVASDEPLIAIDDCFLGSASEVNLSGILPQDVFSAAVSSADAVSGENQDWINGNCTNATTGKATCTFTAGYFTTAPNCTVTGSSATDGRIVTIESLSSTQIIVTTTDDAGTLADIGFQLSCQKTSTDAIQTAYAPDVVAWRVDANITGGSNITFGTTSQSAYVAPNNASLTLTQNDGSTSVGISCSSTNDNTVGSTTCSAGSEEPGIVVNVPRAGTIEVCGSFGHLDAPGASTDDLAVTTQWVNTDNGSQVVPSDTKRLGKSRIQHGMINNGGELYLPVTNCGSFVIDSAGKKTFRLMYEQVVAGTPTTNAIAADAAGANGQRDVHITAKYIDQQVPAPLVVGSVTSNSTGVERIERAFITNSGTPTVSSQSGSWISSITDGGVGLPTINIVGGIFSAAPSCVVTQAQGWASIGTVTSTAVPLTTKGNGGSNNDLDFHIICMGPR